MRLLTATQVERVLDIAACVRAVEDAFRARGEGRPAASAALGFPLPEGALHAKVARLEMARSYVAAKINLNIPPNPRARGLPTIQGVLALFDGVSGIPLAVMDSAPITAARTAATSAVAAKYLARRDAATIGFVGCGVQARAHLAALRTVRPIRSAFAIDRDSAAAERFATAMREAFQLPIDIVADSREGTIASDIIVTSTPAHRPILAADDVSPGTFIAAVGADHEDKQEIDLELLVRAAVFVDDVDQCARIGELHHGIAAGRMSLGDLRGSLDEVVTGACRGRTSDSEIIIFDSTGVAIEDVAAAALVYEHLETELASA
jgi:alanine dehydrogenase